MTKTTYSTSTNQRSRYTVSLSEGLFSADQEYHRPRHKRGSQCIHTGMGVPETGDEMDLVDADRKASWARAPDESGGVNVVCSTSGH